MRSVLRAICTMRSATVSKTLPNSFAVPVVASTSFAVRRNASVRQSALSACIDHCSALMASRVPLRSRTSPSLSIATGCALPPSTSAPSTSMRLTAASACSSTAIRNTR